jgi:hypothetical protein
MPERYFVYVGERRRYFDSYAEAEAYAARVYARTGNIISIEKARPKLGQGD